jgi:fucose permease
MLFIIIISAIILVALNHFDLTEKAANYIVVFLMVAFFAGQYSCRFPKEN